MNMRLLIERKPATETSAAWSFDYWKRLEKTAMKKTENKKHRTYSR